jgi:alpha-L-arabinofuranosidase
LEPRTLLAGTIPTVPVPVAHWTFDEGAGTVAADSTGNGHAATLSAGATWAAGNVGTHSLKVNGSSTGVATATGPVVDTSASFTVSAWVDLATVTGYQTFVSIAGVNVAGFFLQLRGDTGTFAFTRLSSDATGNSTYASATSAPLANTWYHLVGVDDTAAGTLSLYVDGQLSGTAAYTSAWTASGNTLIGHGFYSGSQVDYVNGYIDDVEFFSSALSAAQVVALDEPAAYPFDEGAGTTAADYSGHGNTLTLGASASWGVGDIGSNSLAVNGTATANATNASPVLNTALPFSVSAWVNLNSTSGTQTFASIDGVNVSGFALQLRADTGKFAFTRLASDSNSAQVFQADATTAPSAGVWYNLLGVNDVANGMLLLYVNGVLQSSVSYSGGWHATGATVIGAGKSGGARTNFANGLIDEVRFFDSPLSAGAAAYVGTNGGGILTINSTATGATVSPNLFGAFMEDINYGGEGGIYNNEVRNSGFNDSSNALNAWAAVAGTGVTDTLTSDTTTGPTSALTMSGKLAITSGVSASARAGISNSGYFGVAVAPSTTYTATFYAIASAGFTGPLNVTLESTGGTIYASATVAALTTSWAKYTVTLTTGADAPTSATNVFVISTNSTTANGATIWFGATYLYPPSYDNSPAHLRVDLMQKLVDLHPAFFRVPGGNYLEGNDYADRFNWQATIGPVEDRPGHMDPWGYWSTDDMGLDEYLQMAELAGAQPVLAIYAGYTLNGTSDTGTTLTNDVTSAVNELHYVLDPVTTSWGALRAANGHPAPYNVNYVEIGNEDFFSSTYSTRYPLFYNAIHAAFPSLKIIATSSSTGGSPYDVLDEHYYETPQWFLSNSDYYDSTARGSYDIFVGEYAARDGYQTSTMLDALGDAAWLMGLERNSDLVIMASYAPIWVNVNTGAEQWATDLIGFNNTSSFGSASYYAQQMLNLNHGSLVIGDTIIGSSNLQAIVTRTGGAYYVTVVNPGASASTTTINIPGLSSISSTGAVITLTASSATAVNSVSNPTLIAPVTTVVSGLASTFTQVFPAYSLTILKFSTGDNLPTVATPAAASPATVTGSNASLSVLGADATGESNLTYTWSVTGTPPAAVTFSANGTNAAKNTIATFSKAGAYNFSVAITNASGLTVYSVVTVTVNQTLTGTNATISPAAMTVAPGGSTQFGVYGTDQFGDAIATPISNITWSVYSGVGTISSSGLYTAPAGGSGIATICAITSTGQILYANATLLSEAVWYPANATSGTTLADASGNGKDATLSGAAAFGVGVSGNALNLTGGYASLPTGVVSTLNDFTIAAWVKIDTLSTWSRIFDFGTGTTVNMFLTPRSSSGAVRFAITTSGNGSEQQINGTSALTTGSWQHVAVTLSGNTGTLYVNGVAVGTNTNMTLRPSSLGSTTQNYLGDSQYTADPAFLGSIDDFRIIGRALSAAEIRQFIYPTIITAATASSVTSTSAVLSVLGADATGGESSLKYTWSVIGTPPAPVVFSVNGTNSAKATTATFTRAGTYNFLMTVTNAAGFSTTSSVSVTVYSTIAGRRVFYSGSKFDSISDDSAIATDKQALLPGGMATFVNYTSYSRGINGIMVDIQNLANPGTLSAADFQFYVGNDNNPGLWISAPAPISVTVNIGGGTGGSDRVTIIWADNVIQNQWLQVTVLADTNTGLSSADVFYFGNAIGESGDNPANAVVDAQDEINSRTHKTGFSAAAIDNHYDYNRDGKVNATDDLIARHNPSGATPLQLIAAPVGARSASGDALQPLSAVAGIAISQPATSSADIAALQPVALPVAADMATSQLVALLENNNISQPAPTVVEITDLQPVPLLSAATIASSWAEILPPAVDIMPVLAEIVPASVASMLAQSPFTTLPRSSMAARFPGVLHPQAMVGNSNLFGSSRDAGASDQWIPMLGHGNRTSRPASSQDSLHDAVFARSIARFSLTEEDGQPDDSSASAEIENFILDGLPLKSGKSFAHAIDAVLAAARHKKD